MCCDLCARANCHFTLSRWRYRFVCTQTYNSQPLIVSYICHYFILSLCCRKHLGEVFISLSLSLSNSPSLQRCESKCFVYNYSVSLIHSTQQTEFSLRHFHAKTKFWNSSVAKRVQFAFDEWQPATVLWWLLQTHDTHYIAWSWSNAKINETIKTKF